MRISTKLPITIAALALVSIIATSVLALIRGEEALEQAAFEKLVAVQQSRTHEINGYLRNIKEDIQNMAENGMVVTSALDFQYTFEFTKGGLTKLRELFVDKNPHPEGERHKLLESGRSKYSKTHAEYHPILAKFLERRGYNDLYLVDANGNVVYSTFKGADYATNLIEGQWKDSNLADVFTVIRDNPKPGFVALSDFEPYGPSQGAPASFIGAAMLDGDNFLGAFIAQMPVARTNEIMQNAAGMGETGESFLVGSDFLMRTDSRFSKDPTILKQKVETEPVKRALAGETGIMKADNHKSVQVLSAYGLTEFLGLKWATIAEIDIAEVDLPVVSLRNAIFLTAAILLIVIGAAGFLLARGLTGPIGGMVTTMGRLADGDHEVDIPAKDRRDEIGEMANAVQVFKDNAMHAAEMEAKQAERESRAEEEKRRMMAKVATDFETTVGHVIEGVTKATKDLQTSASSLSTVAERTSHQATTVAAASEEATVNVQTVAAAAEQLASSETEISTQVDRRRHRIDHRYRRTDQSIGPQRHHRGGTGRRRRQGIRRRCLRGEKPRQSDGQSDRRHPLANRQRASGHQRSGGRHCQDQRHDHADRRDRQFDRNRRRGTDGGHPGDRAKCRTGGGGNPGSVVEHRQRDGSGGRNRPFGESDPHRRREIVGRRGPPS